MPPLVLILALLTVGWARTFSATNAPREPPRRSRPVSTVCNISKAECQAELLRAVTAMFGIRGGFAAPEVRFVSTATLAGLNEDQVHRQLVSASVRAALQSLGLLQGSAGTDPGPTPSFQQAVYRSHTHDVLVVLPESERATLHGNVLLVHELVHAVQAKEGLFARQSQDFDQRLAWRARLEGEAVVRSHRFKAEREGLDPSKIDWPKLFDHWSQRSLQSVQRAKFPLAVAVATFPYARGALWFDAAESPKRADAAPAAWPDRFGELLADPGAPRSLSDTTESAPLTCSGEREQLGALSLLAFVLPLGNEPDASAAARGLRSDLLCVHPNGRFTWQLVWPREMRTAAALVQQRAASLGLRVLVGAPSDSSGLRVTVAGRA